ncbi:murein biosynthesis integral membrane protein MurJ [Planococcus salinarum]|nr:murein biosynthesis integral membrane protein MurJ [Planococcus salinarum]TAA72852.1 murein biosynthesis integral membrane protein MurJ [Planococcus salinarum]
MRRTAALLMVITLFSKVIGFAREISLSYFYGASNISDAYYIALTIPDVIFSFIILGIATGFIPMYTKIENKSGVIESHKFTSNLINILTIFSLFLVIVVEMFSLQLVKIFASGFDEETMLLASNFTKVTVLGIFFTGIIYILNGFLQINKNFIVPALFGFVYNFFIILSIFLSYKYDLILLSVGSVAALFFQLLLLLFFTRKNGFKYTLSLDFKNKHVIQMMKLSIPLILGVSVNQINILINKTLASQVAIGGISALNYADRINSFILTIIVMSISTAIYPSLSKAAEEKKIQNFKRIIFESIGAINILIIPAATGLMIFSAPIVTLLFGRGAFDAEAISLTSQALFFYSIGMLGIGLREILSKAFYSHQDTKTPMMNAVIGVLINIILSFVFSKYLGIGGLALATSISAFVTTGLLFYSLRRKFGSLDSKKAAISLIKILIASILMGGISKFTYSYLILEYNNSIVLLFSMVVATLIYLTLIYILKVEEFYTLINLIRGKMKRA